MTSLLEIEGLAVSYGGFKVLDDVSLHVSAKEIVALFGHNGAGKSSLMKAVLGLTPSARGQIKFRGRQITGASTQYLTSLGIAMVPQGLGVFPNLTVWENLKLGMLAANVRAESDEGQKRLQRVFKHLPLLKERINDKAGRLSGGQQQMVSIGRALAAAPSLLLMDEPSIGLSPRVVHEVMELVRRLRDETGVGVLLVEQNVRQALKIAERVYVMKAGKIILETTPEKLTDLKSLWELF